MAGPIESGQVIDGRLLGVRPAEPGRPSFTSTTGRGVLADIAPDFNLQPDPPTGSICLEIDVERHDIRKRVSEPDKFTGQVHKWMDTIRSGNADVVFMPNSYDVRLRSRFDIGRVGGCTLPRDILDFFGGREIPGQMLSLCEDRLMVIDRLALKESQEWWESIRRFAADRPQFPFLIGPGAETQVFQFRNKSDWWTAAYNMRLLADQGIGTSGPRMVRDYKNGYDLPTRQQCAESRQVRLQFCHRALELELIREAQIRSERLPGGPEKYPANSILTPALAGFDAESDWESPMIDRR